MRGLPPRPVAFECVAPFTPLFVLPRPGTVWRARAFISDEDKRIVDFFSRRDILDTAAGSYHPVESGDALVFTHLFTRHSHVEAGEAAAAAEIHPIISFLYFSASLCTSLPSQ